MTSASEIAFATALDLAGLYRSKALSPFEVAQALFARIDILQPGLNAFCVIDRDGALAAALRAGCFYVGALGSRKTHAKRLERLRSLGLDEASLSRIRAPIGLAIGAQSPAEIAVAILAEVIGALRSRGAAAKEVAA